MKLFLDLFAGKTEPPPAPAPTPAQAEMRLFVLQTARGLWLQADAHGRAVLAEAPEPANALLLCVPQGGPQTSFLVATDGRPIGVEGDGFAGPAISARLRRVPGGKLELRHPIAPQRYLGVVFGPAAQPGRVLFDRVGDPVLDRLEPHEAPPDALLPQGRAILGELAHAVVPPMTASRLLHLLLAADVRPALAETLARALPPDELQILARRLATDPATLALFQRAMPADPWLCQALPALLAWDAQGRPRTRRAVSPPAEDHVSVLQTANLRPQAGMALHCLARRAMPPRHAAAIVATARNEGPYLLDWIAHHRALGFERVIIYSNDNDDGSDALLGALADQDEITWIRNELSLASRPQTKAYGHAFKLLPDLLDCRWVMVLDLDEYVSLQPDLFPTIADFTGWHEHQQTDAVALRRLTFVASANDIYDDAPSTRRFTERDPNVVQQFKTLLRPNLFWDSHSHFPFPTLDLPFTYRLEDGSPCHHMATLRGLKMPKEPVTAERAWIAHHVFRTPGEALLKVARGNPTWRAGDRPEAARLDEIVQRFVALAAKPGRTKDTRTLTCTPKAEAEAARLRALPTIDAIESTLKRQAATRVRTLAQTFAQAPPQPHQSEAYATLRRILNQQNSTLAAASPSG